MRKFKSTIFLTMLLSLMFFEESQSNLLKYNANSILKDRSLLNNNSLVNMDEVIVSLKDSANMDMVLDELNRLFENFNGYKVKRYQLIKAIYIKVPKASFELIKSILNSSILSNYIDVIQKNHQYQINSFSEDSEISSNLWAVENRGQIVNGVAGKVDADLDIKEAWEITKGDSETVVAILDTGVDYTHNDLAENIWSGEENGGIDFAGDNEGNNDNDPMPDYPYSENGHYHGTHIAGIIAANGDGGEGVIGVAPNTKIMVLKVFRPNGYSYSSDILEALDYISKKIDEGVKVVAINASYSSSSGEVGDALDRAIQKLGEKGVVFCTAAGNRGENIDLKPVYPANYSANNIIVVGASNQKDELAEFSNYGKKSVDVVASGVNIYSTYPDSEYKFLSGTSMATPQVTGVVALTSAIAPDLTAKERIDAILKNVDRLSNLSSRIKSEGRVNAYKTLSAIRNKEFKGGDSSVANDDDITLEEDSKVLIEPTLNDDIDEKDITLDILVQPKNGSIVVEKNRVLYTPNKNFNGEDKFLYLIKDSKGPLDSATVNITVREKNDLPEPKDDTVESYQNQEITVDVLSNDIDADGDELIITTLTKPKYGVATIKDNKILYNPNSNFTGEDSFNYIVTDGQGGIAKGRVTINVKESIKRNNPPTANDDFAKGYYQTPIDIDVLENDKDIDGDEIEIIEITPPANGEVKVINGVIEYIPNSNFSGDDYFSYTISDTKGEISTANVKVTVKPKIDEETIEYSFPVTTEDGVTTLIKIIGVLFSEQNFGNIKVYEVGDNEIIVDEKGEVRLNIPSTPAPEGKISAGAEVEITKDEVVVKFELDGDLKFK